MAVARSRIVRLGNPNGTLLDISPNRPWTIQSAPYSEEGLMAGQPGLFDLDSGKEAGCVRLNARRCNRS